MQYSMFARCRYFPQTFLKGIMTTKAKVKVLFRKRMVYIKVSSGNEAEQAEGEEKNVLTSFFDINLIVKKKTFVFFPEGFPFIL